MVRVPVSPGVRTQTYSTSRLPFVPGTAPKISDLKSRPKRRLPSTRNPVKEGVTDGQFCLNRKDVYITSEVVGFQGPPGFLQPCHLSGAHPGLLRWERT